MHRSHNAARPFFYLPCANGLLRAAFLRLPRGANGAVSVFARASVTATCRFASTAQGPSFSTTSQPSATTDNGPHRVTLVDAKKALLDRYAVLLEDRQVYYKDNMIVEQLAPLRSQIGTLLLAILQPSEREQVIHSLAHSSLSSCTIRALKEAWLRSQVSPLQAEAEFSMADNCGMSAVAQEKLNFYTHLLSSSLVRTDGDVQFVLQEMKSIDFIEPDVAIYQSILSSLLLLDPFTEGMEGVVWYSIPTETAISTVRIRRDMVGDTAGYYFGTALIHNSPHFTTVSESMWGTFFTLCALTQAAPKLVDLWWGKFLSFCEERHGRCDVASAAASVAPLPYHSLHALLSWCASNRDIERALQFFHESNRRGVYNDADGRVVVSPPGGLTQPSTDPFMQELQLRLLVKLMATGKSIKMDGGLKELVVRDVKRLIHPSVLFKASWGVVNDLISGLSTPSAMRVLKQCSRLSGKGEGDIPFFLWASLLRRCARDHHIDEAESLFFFIRRRFSLEAKEKAELVGIMMRMYATLTPPDCASTVHVFIEHVLRHPQNEPVVKPTVEFYNLLVRAVDSRNAAMMIFLEACSEGVGMNEETFATLLRSTSDRTMSSLNRKLPYDYPATKLDEQIRIPSNVDAHLRREEAQLARGKTVCDSTGDAS